MTPIRRLLCGALAGITSVTFTYPLDIVRTRLSIQSASFSTLSEIQRKNLPGMWATLVIMYKTEGGFFALYRGILPTVAGVAPYVRTEACMSNLHLLMALGWLELHDIRICAAISDTAWRQKPLESAQAVCRSDFRCCRPDLYISIVTLSSPRLPSNANHL